MSSSPRTEADSSGDELICTEGDVAAARERTEKALVVNFCRVNYYVPKDAVLSLPKSPFKLPDGVILGSVLASKAPEKWLAACDPAHLLVLKGREGTSVYCTFAVDDNPGEERFARVVPGQVAEKIFPKIMAEIEADPSRAPRNARQQARFEALKWKAADCNTPQISPVTNAWEVCTEPLKSCRIDPDRVPRKPKRPSGGEDGDHEPVLPTGIKILKVIHVDEKNGYEVIQRPNMVTVIGFSGSPTVDM